MTGVLSPVILVNSYCSPGGGRDLDQGPLQVFSEVWRHSPLKHQSPTKASSSNFGELPLPWVSTPETIWENEQVCTSVAALESEV